jgi:hypothetical protein
MQTPQFLLDLLQVLLDLAVPAAFCTLAAAGVSLRHEGGINFHVNGRTGKWILWTIVLLTLPQLLSWVAAQGINIPSASGSVGTSWLASMETVFKNFVSQIVVAKLVPVLAVWRQANVPIGKFDCRSSPCRVFRPEGNPRRGCG